MDGWMDGWMDGRPADLVRDNVSHRNIKVSAESQRRAPGQSRLVVGTWFHSSLDSREVAPPNSPPAHGDEQ
jgi:hypothetical protein